MSVESEDTNQSTEGEIATSEDRAAGLHPDDDLVYIKQSLITCTVTLKRRAYQWWY